jgi:cyclopropane-fatty-acyl-phospholipid synthase
MSIFSIEQSAKAYRADFVFYAVAIALLSGFLLWAAPVGRAPALLALAIIGLVLWSALEYALHRFVLHGINPFARWHREHHRRPTARVGTPTVLSASLLTGVVLLPAWWLLGSLPASALSLGLFTGYLGYALTHHAVHHGLSRKAPDFGWLRHQTLWHARHHHLAQPCCFGVTTRAWDHVFGTAGHRA